MKRLLISAAAVIVVLTAATTVLRSHPHPAALPQATAAMFPLQALHAAAQRDLPAEDFEDMALVYPTSPRR
jgi:hypothetical protein